MICSVFTLVAFLMEKVTLASGFIGRCVKRFDFGDNDFLLCIKGIFQTVNIKSSCQLEVVTDLKVLEVMLRQGY